MGLALIDEEEEEEEETYRFILSCASSVLE